MSFRTPVKMRDRGNEARNLHVIPTKVIIYILDPRTPANAGGFRGGDSERIFETDSKSARRLPQSRH